MGPHGVPAALIIGSTQLKHVLGIDVDRGEFFETMVQVFEELPNAKWQVLTLRPATRPLTPHCQPIVVGAVSLIFLLCLKRWKKAGLPSSRVVAAALLSWLPPASVTENSLAVR